MGTTHHAGCMPFFLPHFALCFSSCCSLTVQIPWAVTAWVLSECLWKLRMQRQQQQKDSTLLPLLLLLLQRWLQQHGTMSWLTFQCPQQWRRWCCRCCCANCHCCCRSSMLQAPVQKTPLTHPRQTRGPAAASHHPRGAGVDSPQQLWLMMYQCPLHA